MKLFKILPNANTECFQRSAEYQKLLNIG